MKTPFKHKRDAVHMSELVRPFSNRSISVAMRMSQTRGVQMSAIKLDEKTFIINSLSYEWQDASRTKP